MSRRSAQLLDEVKRARSATLKANVDYGSGEIWRDQEAKDIGPVDGISTLVVATTWGLKTYDFAPSQDTFGLFSTSLEGLHRRSAIAWPHASLPHSAELRRFGAYRNDAVGMRVIGIGPACDSR